MNLQFRKSISGRLKLVVLMGVLYALFLVFFSSAKASAAPVDDFIPDGAMPTWVEEYLLSCGGTNNAAAQIGWISLRDQPTVTIIGDVDPGTKTINLQYNVAGIVCRNSDMGGLKSTNNGIIKTQPDLGIVGQTVSYSYGNFNGAYDVGVLAFTYTNPAGFYSSTDITMSITEKRIHTYSVNPKYRCVTNRGDVNFRTPNSSTDFAACRSSGVPEFTLHVNVKTPSPAVSCGIGNTSIIAGNSYTPLVTIAHNGPANAPNVAVNGSLTVRDPSNNVVVSNVVATALTNGASASVDGSAHIYTAGGSYGVTGSFTASSSQPDVSVACSGILTVTLPAPKVSCIVTSETVLLGDSHPVGVSVSHDGPQYAPGISYTAKIAITSQPTQTLSGSLATNQGTSLVTASYPYNTAGVFNVRVDISGSATNSCEGKITVLTGPYVRTYSNDVQTGGGFTDPAGNCTASTGNILTFNKGPAGSYAGSGSQLGVFARNLISGFRSASTRSDATNLPAALSFANTTTGPLTFGGQFGTNMCMTDFWSGRPQQTPTVTQSINLSTFWDPTKTAYSIQPVNAANPIEITGEVPNGRRIALYVEGDVIIKKSNASGHVGYANTAWGSVAAIPSLYVISLGNIGIANDVVALDGQFIAQPSTATNGRITTCVDPATAARYTDDTRFIDSCGNKLVVTGSFSAAHINFLRHFGTLGQATPSEPATNNKAAEVLRYDIATMLGPQPTPSTGNQTYDSITALPPSL